MPRTALLTAAMLALALPLAAAETCVDCHREGTPGLVGDWESSRHAEVGVSCEVCHGEEHNSADDPKLEKAWDEFLREQEEKNRSRRGQDRPER